jgi:hypothetical protein
VIITSNVEYKHVNYCLRIGSSLLEIFRMSGEH